MEVTLHLGDCLEVMAGLPSGSVQTCITSPPYYGLRDYGHNGQIGLEPTPDEYIAKLVAVFREVRRVLRDDGTLWLNLGDSYAGSGKGDGGKTRKQTTNAGSQFKSDLQGVVPSGLKPKDLCMIPARVALALQADGWWLRSDIIWAKPNPMPESVTDRPTKAHEYLFLLSKSARYYYDADAVRESGQEWAGRAGTFARNGAVANHILPGQSAAEHRADRDDRVPAGRNLRSVWSIATAPYKGAHFATFPPRLVEPCIRAGSSASGACPHCGAPWRRVTEKGLTAHDGDTNSQYANGTTANRLALLRQAARKRGGEYTSAKQTIGWQPTCSCGLDATLLPDDLEVIATPTGARIGDDPSLETGRAGYNRPRGDDEGQRPITRYEQRRYAEQLRASPHRNEMAAEAGDAFAHYIRTDKSGARPIPPDLLEQWLARGWLERVIVPDYHPPDPVPCVVLDPFSGSGTTGAVAIANGRNYIGIELNPDYLELARERIGKAQLPLGAVN